MEELITKYLLKLILRVNNLVARNLKIINGIFLEEYDSVLQLATKKLIPGDYKT